VLLCTLAAFAYGVWIDHVIRARFESTKWALPARVYARPLELHPGKKITATELVRELQLLGYQQIAKPDAPGQFARSGSGLEIYSRGFNFWDATEAPIRVRLQFKNERLAAMDSADGNLNITLLRLDPLEIAKIYPRHNEDRVFTRIEDVPQQLIDSIIAVEDRRFFEHMGLDPRAIARAALANLRAGNVRQGGSTITQQLVKNFYLTRERNIGRKLNEAFMAILLDWRYDKAEILEAYVNEIFLGQDGRRAVHGFGAASRFYFGRPLNELATEEMALLAGLSKGASYYDPRRHPERALNRRNLVLELMAVQAMITPAQASRLKRAPVRLASKPASGAGNYPGFMRVLRAQLKRDYRDEDLRREGLQVFSTLDPVVQEVVEQTIIRGITKLERERGLPEAGLQAAVVATVPSNGEILALVGGRKPQFDGFNRALDARRPIGSLIKPAVYLAALRSSDDYSVMSLIEDAPIVWRSESGEVWSPHNYDGLTHGEVTLEEALANSYNLATVRLGMRLGYDALGDSLSALGLENPISEYPSVFLGAMELAPIDIATMYQTLSSGGFRVPLRAITSVLDRNGKPLSRYGLNIEAAVDQADAFLMNYLLSKVVSVGTAKSVAGELKVYLPLAGKTGSTDDLRDSWFAGYGRDIQVVVWLGRDDNQPAGLTGAAGALQLWAAIMKRLRPEPLDLQAPAGVDFQWAHPAEQALADADCSGAIRVPLKSGQLSGTAAACMRGAGGLGRFMEKIKSLWQ